MRVVLPLVRVVAHRRVVRRVGVVVVARATYGVAVPKRAQLGQVVGRVPLARLAGRVDLVPPLLRPDKPRVRRKKLVPPVGRRLVHVVFVHAFYPLGVVFRRPRHHA